MWQVPALPPSSCASHAQLHLHPGRGCFYSPFLAQLFTLPQCSCTSPCGRCWPCPHTVAHPMCNCICIWSTVVSRTCCWHSATAHPKRFASIRLCIPCTIASASQAQLCLCAVFGIVASPALMQVRPSMQQVPALPPCGCTSHAHLHLHPGHGCYYSPFLA